MQPHSILRFTPQPANTLVTIVLSDVGEHGLVSTLIGGTLGELLDGVLGALLTGTPSLEITAQTASGTNVKKFTFVPSIQNADVRISPEGYYYLTVVPNGAYQRIQIELNNFAVLGVAAHTYVRVHDVFVLEGEPDPCDPFITTSIDALGLEVAVLDANPNPISNPQNAIDGDINTYSQLGYSALLTAYIGGSFIQKFYFNNPILPSEQPTIAFDFPGSLLSADLIGNISVKAYKNGVTDPVYQANFSSLLNVELLALLKIILGESAPVTINLPTNDTIHRIEIKYVQVLELDLLSPPMRIYEVTRAPKIPALELYSSTNCANATYTFKIDSPYPDNEYLWKNKNGVLLHTGTQFTTDYPAHGQSDTLFVQASNCVTTSSPLIVVLSGNEDYCMPSDVFGDVNREEYFSFNPLNAVAVDITTNQAIAFAPVDDYGNYNIPNLERGTYKVVIVNEDIVLGNIYNKSSVDPGYEILPEFASLKINGLGAPESVPQFQILFAPLSYNNIDIQAERNNDPIVIDWSVTNPRQYLSYTVEKSYNAVQFTSVRTIKSGATSTSKYQYIDQDWTNSDIFYRVQAVDNTHNKSYSRIVKVTPQGRSYNIYPNPVSNSLRITNAKGSEQYEVIDINGRKMDISVQGNEILVDNLTPGLYILSIIDQSKITRIKFEKI